MVETAIREAKEEIGLKREEIKILGNFHDAISLNGLKVTPVISFITPKRENFIQNLKINKEEVDLVLTLPVSHFFDEKNVFFREITSIKHPQRLISYRTEDPEIDVWGLTAYFIHHTLKYLSS